MLSFYLIVALGVYLFFIQNDSFYTLQKLYKNEFRSFLFIGYQKYNINTHSRPIFSTSFLHIFVIIILQYLMLKMFVKNYHFYMFTLIFIYFFRRGAIENYFCKFYFKEKKKSIIVSFVDYFLSSFFFFLPLLFFVSPFFFFFFSSVS